jgi:hypothetical protein
MSISSEMRQEKNGVLRPTVRSSTEPVALRLKQLKNSDEFFFSSWLERVVKASTMRREALADLCSSDEPFGKKIG